MPRVLLSGFVFSQTQILCAALLSLITSLLINHHKSLQPHCGSKVVPHAHLALAFLLISTQLLTIVMRNTGLALALLQQALKLFQTHPGGVFALNETLYIKGTRVCVLLISSATALVQYVRLCFCSFLRGFFHSLPIFRRERVGVGFFCSQSGKFSPQSICIILSFNTHIQY